MMRRYLPHITLLGSCLALCLAAFAMSRRIEPFYSWFYLFAWWPYIFAVESLLRIRGANSLLWQQPKTFWALLPASVVVWCLFELLNFRLHNWHYINVPNASWLRWCTYALCYATVLPAIFATARLLHTLGLFRQTAARPLSRPRQVYPHLLAAGTACLLLPLLWPGLFFPLVWLAALFLIDPLLHNVRAGSFLDELGKGAYGHICRLLAAGLICGFLWEGWNYWAGAKWYYTLPYLMWPKVFEMPVAGYLGFAPFALGCLALYRLQRYLWQRFSSLRPVMLLLGVVFVCAVFFGIDRLTVASFG